MSGTSPALGLGMLFVPPSAASLDGYLANTAAPLDVCGFRVAAARRSVDIVCGDFYEIVGRGAGRVQVVIGDACGRGTRAGQLVARVRPYVRALRGVGLGPAAVLDILNATVCSEFPGDAFVTAACLELDAHKGQLRVANAGHVPPVVRRRSGESIIVGRASGPPLGMLDSARYSEESTSLHRGDSVVLMTDGVLEAFETDLIDMGSLMSLLALAPRDVCGINEALLQKVSESVHRTDDATVVSLSYPSSAGDESSATRPSLT